MDHLSDLNTNIIPALLSGWMSAILFTCWLTGLNGLNYIFRYVTQSGLQRGRSFELATD